MRINLLLVVIFIGLLMFSSGNSVLAQYLEPNDVVTDNDKVECNEDKECYPDGREVGSCGAIFECVNSECVEVGVNDCPVECVEKEDCYPEDYVESKCGTFYSCVDNGCVVGSRACENECEVKEDCYDENANIPECGNVYSCVDNGCVLLAVDCVDEDENEVDDETEDEIEQIGNNHGAMMRFLQLEFAIKKRVLWMNAVIDRIDNNGDEVTELREVVVEMNLLAEEAENVDFSMSKDELVKLFIDIKEDARELVKKFRRIARAQLNESDNSFLRTRFSEIEKDDLKELRDKIRDKRRDYNRERTKKFLDDMDIEDGELLKKIENGDISKEEIVRRLREKRRSLGQSMESKFESKVREEANDRRIEVRKEIKEFIDGREVRIEERMKERSRSIG
jgi:hypothetical protein